MTKPRDKRIVDKVFIIRIQQFIVIRNINGTDLDIRITDTYGKTRQDLAGNKKEHHGWDFAAPTDSLILWMYDGNETKVEGKYYAKWSGQIESASYGYQISIMTEKDHNKYVLRFCHILNETIYKEWSRGTKVNSGVTLAKVGTSGRNPKAKSPHLHLEVFKQNKNKYVRIDPLEFFQIALKDIPQTPTGFRILIN